MVVFISSNQENTRRYCRQAIEAGHTPILAQQAMADKLEMLSICDEIWMFGKPTCGMQMELDYARDNDIPYRLFPD